MDGYVRGIAGMRHWWPLPLSHFCPCGATCISRRSSGSSKGDLSFIAIAEKFFKNHRHSKTKNRHRHNFLDIDTTFWWLLCVFILIFFNSNGKFGHTRYGFLLGLPHKPHPALTHGLTLTAILESLDHPTVITLWPITCLKVVTLDWYTPQVNQTGNRPASLAMKTRFVSLCPSLYPFTSFYIRGWQFQS